MFLTILYIKLKYSLRQFWKKKQIKPGRERNNFGGDKRTSDKNYQNIQEKKNRFGKEWQMKGRIRTNTEQIVNKRRRE